MFIADLAELDQVRRVAGEIAARWPALDVLVNNAGHQRDDPERTSDGLRPHGRHQLPVAAPAHRACCSTRCGRAAPSRVVNVASEAHRLADRLDPTTIPQLGSRHDGIGQNRLYGRTKLALLLVMQELAARTAADRIDVSSCCPGLVATNLAGSESGFTHASKLLARTPLVRRPEQGAAIVVRLASDPAMEGRTGGFHSSTPGAGLLPARRSARATPTCSGASSPPRPSSSASPQVARGVAPGEGHLGDERVAAAHERGPLEVVEGVGRARLRLDADGVARLVVEHDVVAGAGHRHLERPGPREAGGPRHRGEAVVPRALGGRRLDEAEGQAVDAARVPALGVELDLEAAADLDAAAEPRVPAEGGGEGGRLGVHLQPHLEPVARTARPRG